MKSVVEDNECWVEPASFSKGWQAPCFLHRARSVMRFVFPMLLVVGLAGLGGTVLAGGTSPGRSSGSVAGGGARNSGGGTGGRAGVAPGASAAPSGAVGQAWGAGGGGGALAGGAGGGSPGSAPGWPAGLGVETPLVYRQAGYLGTIGPAPMRFGLASPGCNERTPPRVGTTAKKSSAGAAFQPTVPVPPNNGGAGGTVSSGEPPALGGGDSTVGVREQIMSFFVAPGDSAGAASGAPGAPGGQNPNLGGDAAAELQRNRLRSLLDPVPMFQPAPPPPIPPSSATFRQN